MSQRHKRGNVKQLDFQKLLAGVSGRLQSRIDLSSVYAHPSGTGDDREYAIHDILREVLPERFKVVKGKVFDSHGRLSNEIDALIVDRDTHFGALEVGGRSLVPVESLLAAIEVKSQLSGSELSSAIQSLESLALLRRHLVWTDRVLSLSDENKQLLAAGIPATTSFPFAGKVWTAVIGLEGAKADVLVPLTAAAPNHLLFVAVTNGGIIVRDELNAQTLTIPLEERTIGILAWFILDMLSANERSAYFRPEVGRYRNAVMDVANIKALRHPFASHAEETHPGETDPSDGGSHPPG